MKRNFLKGVVATVIVALLVGYGVRKSANNSSTELNELTLANVEALAFYEGVSGNTGPAQLMDCKGLGTGDRKICLSENSNSCTETGCF